MAKSKRLLVTNRTFILILGGDIVDRKTISLDSIDWGILMELQKNARISYKNIGGIVGLSSPSVRDRIRRMEDLGVILKYSTVIAPAVVGYDIRVIVSLKSKHAWPEHHVPQFLDQIPSVIHYWGVTGRDEDYFIELLVPSMNKLEEILQSLSAVGLISTFVVLSYSGDNKVLDKI